MSTARRFAGVLKSITGLAYDSITELIARRQISAGYDYLKNNPTAKPEFTTIEKTITLMIPTNTDGVKFMEHVNKESAYVGIEYPGTILLNSQYAARVGWKKYRDELISNFKPEPSKRISILTQLKKLENEYRRKNPTANH